MNPRCRTDVPAAPALRVIGVDPGSETTGVGIVEHAAGKSRVLFWEAIAAGREPTFPGRLRLIHEHLTQAVALYQPHSASVENVFYALNVQSALKLGQTRGAVLLSLELAGVETFSYTPLEIKKALVGYGRAGKEQVRDMVRLLLGLAGREIPIDASDALAAALCHVNHHAVRSAWDLAAANTPGPPRLKIGRRFR
ncbi:MAG: crossover junction endodeoxyribonuclease RuvC [Acidobacteria bacterium]|nr:crossover junction endodeoxyribonuclease RuvC [Acidobacteriota bacterium]